MLHNPGAQTFTALHRTTRHAFQLHINMERQKELETEILVELAKINETAKLM